MVRDLREPRGAVVRGSERSSMATRFSLKENARRSAAEAERQAICLALRATQGNKSAAARLLSVDYKTLYLKMKRYAIGAGEFSAP